jgi:O-antigen/teichoic acid export membrane protein
MIEAATKDSFPKRLIYKLVGNLLGVLLSFFQAGLVSRALGPRSYGDYNFLINFFNQFVAFLEMRSSTFLYTSLSRDRAKTAVVAVYFFVALAISVVTVLFPVGIIAFGVQNAIWPDQNAVLIVVASFVALIIWYTDLFAKTCDALGITVSLERARVVTRIILFVGIAVAAQWSVLNIQYYFTLQFVANLLLIGVLGLALRRTKAFDGRPLHTRKPEMRSTLADVFSFSHPLFVYTLTALICDYADRWLLQRFGGSIQQGLFSLALNIGVAFNVLINALQPLVMREFSIAFEQEDWERARNVFAKLITASYTVSAFFLCYAAVNAEACIRIVGGRSFQDAAGVFAIMAFLPIVHNYSLLSGSTLYAAHKTRLLRNIGLITSPLSIAAAFLLVGPKEYGAMNFGAIGLALKMVVLEFFGTNVILYFNSRMLAFSFRRYFFHQVFVVAVLTAAAFGSREAALYVLDGTSKWIQVMVLGGLLYAAVSLLMFHFIPFLVGIDKREAIAFLKKALSKSPSSLNRSTDSVGL